MLVHTLLSKLMAIFPTDRNNKPDELEILYATVGKVGSCFSFDSVMLIGVFLGYMHRVS